MQETNSTILTRVPLTPIPSLYFDGGSDWDDSGPTTPTELDGSILATIPTSLDKPPPQSHQATRVEDSNGPTQEMDQAYSSLWCVKWLMSRLRYTQPGTELDRSLQRALGLVRADGDPRTAILGFPSTGSGNDGTKLYAIPKFVRKESSHELAKKGWAVTAEEVQT
ncbi:hypothetical protein M231_03000 [Tremella mesenterica]|uniref:Uncharacterized protein n=1 Tax=Tremella mesenterica TaxID=5217 RepID=A0A4Q1BP39_TREME|nr:hypothetical protein M231_03000 [Tremella mesenterica]